MEALKRGMEVSDVRGRRLCFGVVKKMLIRSKTGVLGLYKPGDRHVKSQRQKARDNVPKVNDPTASSE